jgi:hypothetical protein
MSADDKWVTNADEDYREYLEDKTIGMPEWRAVDA